MARSSPIDVLAARRILAYDDAVFDRYARRVRRLPKAGAFRDRGTGHGSYFATLVHILNVKDAWLNYIVPGRLEAFLKIHANPERHPTDWRGFTPYHARVRAGVAAFAAGLSERGLARVVRAPWMRGRYTVGDAVLQTSYEEAHHLGEIIGAFWQTDTEPPDMTWIDVGRSARGSR